MTGPFTAFPSLPGNKKEATDHFYLLLVYGTEDKGFPFREIARAEAGMQSSLAEKGLLLMKGITKGGDADFDGFVPNMNRTVSPTGIVSRSFHGASQYESPLS